MDLFSLCCTTVIFIILLKLFMRSRNEKLLDKLPGPGRVPLFGNTLEFIGPPQKRFKVLRERDLKYPGMYRTYIGNIPMVHITSAAMAEVILGSNVFIEKSFSYKLIRSWLGTGLLTSGGEKWFRHRKLITPTFHFKILDSFLEVFNDNSKILISKLSKLADNQTEFDVYPFITHCALDIICETAMGTKVSAQSQENSPYVTALYRVARLTVQRIVRPWLHSDFIYPKTPSGKEYYANLKILHDFTTNVIKERMDNRRNTDKEVDKDNDVGMKTRKAFLDLLLDASEDDKAHPLSATDIREEVDTFMFEGHDTTTAGITWTLFLLGSHPDIQQGIFEELEEIFQDDPNRNPTMKDVGEMKYLERAIKESLRLYPPVPMFSRALQKDLQLGEYLIPKGSNIGFHVYSLHRDPQTFPNPERFDPDNFLPERTQNRHPYAYIPFSAGPRNCIGQRFALLEEKVVLSNILRKFKIESIEKREDLQVVLELILRPLSGVKLKLTHRNKLK